MARENILVVDDEKDARETVCELLKEEKYRPLGAKDGLEAERRIKRNAIDLAMIDLKMPGMDGMELIRRFRESNSEVPIVIITGYPSLESSVEALRLKVYDYIIKPFTIEEVKLVVNRAIEKRRLAKTNGMLIQQLERAKRELEKRVRQRTRKLEKAYQELKRAQERLVRTEKLTTVGRLGAGVAHELNNPLGIILMNIQRLAQKMAEERAKTSGWESYQKAIERIKEASFRSQRIINNLLDFSRVSPPEFTPVNINRVLDETLPLVEHQVSLENIKIIKKYDSHLPKVLSDPSQLKQVFINLILNAQQAMPQGGKLYITAKKKKDFIEVKVRDTGCGIPKEDLGKVFDPFFTSKKGIGMGLFVSHGIIEKHHGSIEIKSRKGEGTTVIIHLPR